VKATKGRVVAFAAAVAAATITFAWVYVFLEPPIMEQWYLSRLESDNQEERRAAIRALGDLRSRRAIQALRAISREESGLASRALIKILYYPSAKAPGTLDG
jgi:hypothetical protein